jgi:hypothetical protein
MCAVDTGSLSMISQQHDGQRSAAIIKFKRFTGMNAEQALRPSLPLAAAPWSNSAARWRIPPLQCAPLTAPRS